VLYVLNSVSKQRVANFPIFGSKLSLQLHEQTSCPNWTSKGKCPITKRAAALGREGVQSRWK